MLMLPQFAAFPEWYLHANFGFGNGYQDGYYLMDIKTSTITFETAIPLIFKDNAMTIMADFRKK